MNRSCIACLLAGSIGLIDVTQAVGQQACKPTLAFKEVQFSGMQPPTGERRWTAVVSVDASRCTRQKENGGEIEFRERFQWSSPAVKVGLDFWADEAVEYYWIESVQACPCAR